MTSVTELKKDDVNFGAEILVTTKFIPPRTQNKLVHRQRLFDKLSATAQSLVLISAPAGFGKTTLLSGWLEQQKRPVAWLSLDENDNDSARFLNYFIRAMQTIDPGYGQKEAHILSLPQAPNVPVLLQTLVNQLCEIKSDIFLALDDYHVIKNDEIHHVLDFIIKYKPDSLTVAVTSRTKPPIALSRLRVRRQLVEIGDIDLRFTHEEASRFLNQIVNLNLSIDDVTILESRTEGWIAGLQLAAISLEDEKDKESFIQAFAGDDRYVMDYLTDEVLHRQTEQVRQFLLETAILDRLCGSLCDKLTNRNDSADLLEQLERSNMFVIPLDNKRCWYRYHHLFADLLREQLQRFQPEKQALLHHDASEWFSNNGNAHEAIQHAFEVNDYEQVAIVLNQHGQRLFDEGQAVQLMSWYKRLPESVVKKDPCHMLRRVWSHFLGCGEVLQDLIEELQHAFEMNKIDASEEQRSIMEIDLSLMAGFQALQNRQIDSVKKYGNRALQQCQSAGMSDAIPPRLLLASACYANSDLNDAKCLFEEIIENSFKNNYLIALNPAICGLGRVLTEQGQLRDAHDHLNDDLRRLADKGLDQHLVDTAWIYLALSELAYQTNELDECLQYLEKAKTVANKDSWDALPAMIDIRFSKVYFAKGELKKAQFCISAVRNKKIKPSLLPLFPNVDNEIFAIEVSQGNFEGLDKWLKETGLEDQKEPLLEQTWENIMFARVLVRQHNPERALNLIMSLILTAEQQQHKAAVIELLVLQALARQNLGQTRMALQTLKKALGYAEKQRFVRVFIDEGAPIAALLKHLDQGPTEKYVQFLLNQMNEQQYENYGINLSIEPLSKKEQQTLSLLVAGLTNKEIAEKMYVSANTVKTHLKNIYQKLNVKNRIDAVSKGKKLINRNL